MGAKKDPVYGAFESGWLGQYGGAFGLFFQ